MSRYYFTEMRGARQYRHTGTVTAEKMDTLFRVTTSRDENLTGQAGDYLVTEADGTQHPVEAAIFESCFVSANTSNPNEYQRKDPVRAVHIGEWVDAPFTHRNVYGYVRIQGDDWVISDGPESEWRLPRATFESEFTLEFDVPSPSEELDRLTADASDLIERASHPPGVTSSHPVDNRPEPTADDFLRAASFFDAYIGKAGGELLSRAEYSQGCLLAMALRAGGMEPIDQEALRLRATDVLDRAMLSTDPEVSAWAAHVSREIVHRVPAAPDDLGL